MGTAIENMYPLSPMQEGLLFHARLSPTAGTYVPQIVLSLSGKWEEKHLKQAWEQAITRHSSLRTGFYWEQRDQPFQIVYRQRAIAWSTQDWQLLSATDQSAKLQILLDCNRTEAFNLNQPPLMRLTWVDRGHDVEASPAENRYYLIWCYHHLILDGWSASQLLKEVFQQYFVLAENLSPVSFSPARPYADYIAWLRQQDTAAAKSFWQTYLQGWDGPVSLPILKSQQVSTVSTPDCEQPRSLSAKATQRLKAFAQTHKITLNTLVQAALGLVLSRYCDTADVVFGTTCAGRPAELPGALSMVGLFINTLPVRVQIATQTTVASWLQALGAQQSTTTDYEYVSLRELQTWTNEGRGLFDCLLVFESYPVAAEMFQGQTELKLEGIQFNEWTHFPLTLLVSAGEQLTFTAKYRSDQLVADTASRFLGHLCNVITTIAKNPDQHLQNISLLCSAEKKQLAAWNDTAVEHYPLDQTLPDLFEAQVERTPEAIALTFANQSLTYQALNEKSNQLAHFLQNLGIGPEQRVAIRLERSLEMAIALLAVVKAGAAYVPLDPSYPEARLDYMLADADVSAVLTDISVGSQQPTANPQRTLSPSNSAYVIYTSGSTGRPKGVINTHRGIVNRLSWMQQAYSLTAGQRVLHKTPLSFDVSVWEIFWPLLNGATLVIAKPDGHKDSAYLTEVIQAQKVAILHFVPSMLAAFLEAPEVKGCTDLRQVVCSGEALPVALQEKFFKQLPNAQLHNLYGPTEAAIDVTAWQCQAGSQTVPIGRPIANTQIHLLDSDLNPVPIGVPGEIYIGGIGVARGYLNRPLLTAECFVPSPLGFTGSTQPTECPLYKTGDLARYRADGALEYIGRRDSQIKLRGVRVELGEIEAALNDHPAIRQAAVTIRGDISGDRDLTAYVVKNVDSTVNLGNACDNKTPGVQSDHRALSVVEGRFNGTSFRCMSLTQDLSTFLKTKLPEVMVPTRLVVLDALPLTPSGKLDRLALPQPEQPQTAEVVEPRNDTERAIASIWATVLQLEHISISDDFFELGGHSLSATRVNTRLRKHFGIVLPLQSSFEYPTVEALATHIDALKIGTATHSPVGHKEIEL